MGVKGVRDIGVRGIWGFLNFGTSPVNSKSDSNSSPTEISSIRGLQTSDSLKEPQRASEGLVGSPGAYLFLVFFYYVRVLSKFSLKI